MIDPKFFDYLTQQLSSLLPDTALPFQEDFKKNARATLQTIFSKLNLVTREEFDVQTQLLAKARAKLAELEAEMAAFKEPDA